MNATKQTLSASLKRWMLKKPLDKITIQDLTSDCGMSRMAFYYHFNSTPTAASAGSAWSATCSSSPMA